MTLISSTYSWGLDPKESSGYKEQKGLLETSTLARGEFTKVFLKGNKLGAGLGQNVGPVW